jgi:hypothetical protein
MCGRSISGLQIHRARPVRLGRQVRVRGQAPLVLRPTDLRWRPGAPDTAEETPAEETRAFVPEALTAWSSTQNQARAW